MCSQQVLAISKLDMYLIINKWEHPGWKEISQINIVKYWSAQFEITHTVHLSHSGSATGEI